MKVFNRIADLRRKFNFSQSELGEFVGVSAKYLNLIETNQWPCSLDFAFLLMYVFNCSFDDIFYVEFDGEEF